MTNLHQQADATARVVRSLDVQLETITTEVDGTTSSLLRAEDELAVKKAVLQRRLIDIYKRGPLYTTKRCSPRARSASCSVATSTSTSSRCATGRSSRASRTCTTRSRSSGSNSFACAKEFERSRQEKRDEEDRLRALEENRAKNLSVVKRSAKETEARLAAIGRDETA